VISIGRFRNCLIFYRRSYEEVEVLRVLAIFARS
jgi:hypothetical protein